MEYQTNIALGPSSGASRYKVTAKTNAKEGYDISFCYSCEVEVQGSGITEKTVDNLRVVQTKNTAPEFKGPIEPKHDISLVRDIDGELNNLSVRTYRSPVAVDKEGDRVIMMFEGETEAIKVNQN